jgi:hypothetical protein
MLLGTNALKGSSDERKVSLDSQALLDVVCTRHVLLDSVLLGSMRLLGIVARTSLRIVIDTIEGGTDTMDESKVHRESERAQNTVYTSM